MRDLNNAEISEVCGGMDRELVIVSAVLIAIGSSIYAVGYQNVKGKHVEEKGRIYNECYTFGAGIKLMFDSTIIPFFKGLGAR